MAILTKESVTYDDLDLIWKDDAPPKEGEISEEAFDEIYGEWEDREHGSTGSTEETYDFNDNPLTLI